MNHNHRHHCTNGHQNQKHNQHRHKARALSLFGGCLVLVSICATHLGARLLVESKPLNQNQVKFRRLPPKEFSAALGSSITIECEAGASPPPTIHWLKNGKRISQVSVRERACARPGRAELGRRAWQ